MKTKSVRPGFIILLLGLLIFYFSLTSTTFAITNNAPNLGPVAQFLTDTNRDFEPSMVFDSSGNWHLVYQTAVYTDTTNTSYIKYLNSNNESGILAVAALSSSNGLLNGYFLASPTIAIDPNGGLNVAYVYDYTNESTNVNWSRIMFKSNTSGSWSTAKHLTKTTRDFEPSLTFDSNGDWHLVYQYAVQSGSSTTLYIKYLNSRNETRNLAVAKLNYGDGALIGYSLASPTIAIDPNGGLNVAYVYDYINESTNVNWSRIMFKSNTSGSWSTAKHLTKTTRDFEPSLTFDSNGDWHLVYQYAVQSGSTMTSYIKYLNSNNELKTLAEATFSFNNGQVGYFLQSPSISIDPNGGLNVAYVYGYTNENTNENWSRIMGITF